MESAVKTNESPMTSEPNQPPPVTTTTQNPPPSTSIPNPPPPPFPKVSSNLTGAFPARGSELPPQMTTLNFNTFPPTISQGQTPYFQTGQNLAGFSYAQPFATPTTHTRQRTNGLFEEGVVYEEEYDEGVEDVGLTGGMPMPQYEVIGDTMGQTHRMNDRNDPRNQPDFEPRRQLARRAQTRPRPIQQEYIPPPQPYRNYPHQPIVPVPRRMNQRPARGIEAHFKPIITNNPSPVVIPQNHQGRTFEVRANSLQSLPKFHGIATEEPYFHLESYDSICNTIGLQGFSPNEVKLVLFQFSLEDKAKRWFHTLPSASIFTWAEMQEKFLGEYFTAQMTSDARRNIRNFQQQVGEPFHEAFDRIRMMLRRCPHHGIALWEIVNAFNEGLTPEDARDLMSISNGTFGSNYEDEDWDFLEQQAITSKRRAKVSRRSRQSGVRTLSE